MNTWYTTEAGNNHGRIGFPRQRPALACLTILIAAAFVLGLVTLGLSAAAYGTERQNAYPGGNQSPFPAHCEDQCCSCCAPPEDTRCDCCLRNAGPSFPERDLAHRCTWRPSERLWASFGASPDTNAYPRHLAYWRFRFAKLPPKQSKYPEISPRAPPMSAQA